MCGPCVRPCVRHLKTGVAGVRQVILAQFQTDRLRAYLIGAGGTLLAVLAVAVALPQVKAAAPAGEKTEKAELALAEQPDPEVAAAEARRAASGGLLACSWLKKIAAGSVGGFATGMFIFYGKSLPTAFSLPLAAFHCFSLNFYCRSCGVSEPALRLAGQKVAH